MPRSRRILYHTTPYWNVEKIRQEGILPERSKGANRVIWLHGWRQLAWALSHLSNHHQCGITDLATLEVAVRNVFLQRTGKTGRLIYFEPIPKCEIIRVFRFRCDYLPIEPRGKHMVNG